MTTSHPAKAAAGQASGRSRRLQQASRDAIIMAAVRLGLPDAAIAAQVGVDRATVGRVRKRFPAEDADRWRRLTELADAGQLDHADTFVLARLARAAAATDPAARIALEALRIASLASRGDRSRDDRRAESG